MINYKDAFINTNAKNFPETKAIDTTAPGLNDGTEIIKELVNDNWGFSEALLHFVGDIPNGMEESFESSQKLDAILKMISRLEEVEENGDYKIKKWHKNLILNVKGNVTYINLIAEETTGENRILIFNGSNNIIEIIAGEEINKLALGGYAEYYYDKEFKNISKNSNEIEIDVYGDTENDTATNKKYNEKKVYRKTLVFDLDEENELQNLSLEIPIDIPIENVFNLDYNCISSSKSETMFLDKELSKEIVKPSLKYSEFQIPSLYVDIKKMPKTKLKTNLYIEYVRSSFNERNIVLSYVYGNTAKVKLINRENLEEILNIDGAKDIKSKIFKNTVYIAVLCQNEIEKTYIKSFEYDLDTRTLLDKSESLETIKVIEDARSVDIDVSLFTDGEKNIINDFIYCMNESGVFIYYYNNDNRIYKKASLEETEKSNNKKSFTGKSINGNLLTALSRLENLENTKESEFEDENNENDYSIFFTFDKKNEENILINAVYIGNENKLYSRSLNSINDASWNAPVDLGYKSSSKSILSSSDNETSYLALIEDEEGLILLSSKNNGVWEKQKVTKTNVSEVSLKARNSAVAIAYEEEIETGYKTSLKVWNGEKWSDVKIIEEHENKISNLSLDIS